MQQCFFSFSFGGIFRAKGRKGLHRAELRDLILHWKVIKEVLEAPDRATAV